MVEGETEDFIKQEVIFSCASICKSFYTLYGAMTACIMLTFQEPIREVVNVKRNYQRGYPSYGDPSFRALAVSWDLPTTTSESSSSGSLITVSCSVSSLS
jgi:hypothetical protein